jgi:hypothetical protein
VFAWRLAERFDRTDFNPTFAQRLIEESTSSCCSLEAANGTGL